MTLFFTGYKMYPKNYICYFPKIDLIFDPVSTENQKFSELCSIENQKFSELCSNVVITHSVGIIKCLNYFHSSKTKPLIIISIDPPDISIDAIKNRYDDLNHDLKLIYDQFLEKDINVSNYNISIYRNRKKFDYKDKNIYKVINYYDEDTHHPYTIKKIRDKIIKDINF
jgi:hypothetical protein